MDLLCTIPFHCALIQQDINVRQRESKLEEGWGYRNFPTEIN